MGKKEYKKKKKKKRNEKTKSNEKQKKVINHKPEQMLIWLQHHMLDSIYFEEYLGTIDHQHKLLNLKNVNSS